MTLKKKRQRSFLKASPSANEKSGLSRAKRGGESPGLQGEARRLGKPLFVYLPLSKPRQAPLGRFGGQTRRSRKAQALKSKKRQLFTTEIRYIDARKIEQKQTDKI